MSVGTQGTPPLSPDGRSWWDGQSWQPLFTPDGRARWNGREWVPVVEPFGAPAEAGQAAAAAPVAVMPAAPFQAAAAPAPEAAPSWLAQPPANIPAPPPPVAELAPQAAPAYPVYAPPAAGGSRLLIYGAGILLVLVLVAAGWAFRGQLLSSSTPEATPSPDGTQYERADRFLNVQLEPYFVALNDTLPAFTANCTAQLPPSCQDAIAATDQKLRNLLAFIDIADIPPCIAPQVKTLRADLAGMDAGLQMSLGGYQGNSRPIIAQGFLNASVAARTLKPDADAVTAAEQSCPR